MGKRYVPGIKLEIIISVFMILVGVLYVFLPIFSGKQFNTSLLFAPIVAILSLVVFIAAKMREGQLQYIISGMAWILNGINLLVMGGLLIPSEEDIVWFIFVPCVIFAIPLLILGCLLIFIKNLTVKNNIADYLKEIGGMVATLVVLYICSLAGIIATLSDPGVVRHSLQFGALAMWGLIWIGVIIVCINSFVKRKEIKENLLELLLVTLVIGLQATASFSELFTVKITVVILQGLLLVIKISKYNFQRAPQIDKNPAV
ncbi:MAG: hypothetical protein ACFFDW_10340 [Candidatus Thorarchaeota archaeon]